MMTEPTAEDRVREGARRARAAIMEHALGAEPFAKTSRECLTEDVDGFEKEIRALERESTAARYAALVEAAQRWQKANLALTALHEKEAVDATATDAQWAGLVADAWFEHDRARDSIYAALRALTASAPSEETAP